MQYVQPDGYLAVPPTGKGNAVLDLNAWWGLNDSMKAFCKRLAESGFVAFAPDLYHGKVADNMTEAETLSDALFGNPAQAKANIAEATMYLNERAGQADRGLAVIGFSLGAFFALDLSVTNPEYIRSTGHWFFEPNRSQAYNQAAASLAWDRTLAFLKRSTTL